MKAITAAAAISMRIIFKFICVPEEAPFPGRSGSGSGGRLGILGIPLAARSEIKLPHAGQVWVPSGISLPHFGHVVILSPSYLIMFVYLFYHERPCLINLCPLNNAFADTCQAFNLPEG